MLIKYQITNPELAILGLVAETPKYGYQIEQQISERGMREWTEIGFSSIYHILNKLERSGWLFSEKFTNKDRPARKVYQMTPRGKEIYCEAVIQRLSCPQRHTGDFDLAIANLPALSGEEIKSGLDTYRQNLITQLEKVDQKWIADGRGHLSRHIELLFDHSIFLLKAELEWVDKTITEMQGDPDG